MVPKSIEWIGEAETGFLRLLDQTRLPGEVAYRDCRAVDDVWDAIKRLQVRGAPAIGVAAAYGVVLGMRGQPQDSRSLLPHASGLQNRSLQDLTNYLRSSRPTAVNLFWALDRMDRVAGTIAGGVRDAGRSSESVRPFVSALLAEARAIHLEDVATCKAIGIQGAALIPDGGGVLTHCNTGALATADYGTALAALFVAHEQGKRFQVYADETRPLLQGARLTAWELGQRGIPVTLICDNMAGQVMKEGKVGLVIVGADRIAANGDTANKIGTYGLAILARYHAVPFYVAAPRSTFDLSLPDGSGIPIEQRQAEEITEGFGRRTAPVGVAVYNPAFDVTPASLISGIVTEAGLIQPVNSETIRAVVARQGCSLFQGG